MAKFLVERWPRCIAKLHAIDIALDLYRPLPMGQEEWIRLATAGEFQINSVLNNLYEHIREECRLLDLRVLILADFNGRCRSLYHILSPISALAALAEQSSFEGPSDGSQFEIAAYGFRQLYGYENELMAEVELANAIRVTRPEETLMTQAAPHLEALTLCKLVLRPRTIGSFSTFAHHYQLATAASFIGRRLDDLKASRGESRTWTKC